MVVFTNCIHIYEQVRIKSAQIFRSAMFMGTPKIRCLDQEFTLYKTADVF